MPVPASIQKSLCAISTDEDAVLLVVISNADWPSDRRYSSHGSEIVEDGDVLRFGLTSSGDWYDHAIVSVPPIPDDRENTLGSATLKFESVERDMGALVSENIEKCTVSLIVVPLSSPDEVLAQVQGYAVLSAEASDEGLTLEIGFDPLVKDEPMPAWRMNKKNCPGLFR